MMHPRGHVHIPAACYRPWAVTSIGAEGLAWGRDAFHVLQCKA